MSKALYDVVGGVGRKVKKAYGVVPTAAGSSKNLLPVYDIEAIVTNGVTHQDGVQCERNEDGSIHVYGTALELDNKFHVVHPDRLCKFPSGTYTMSVGAALPGSMRLSFEYYSSDGKSWLGNYGAINASNPTRTVEINEEHSLSLYIFVPVGMTVDITLYPQLELGSVATDYVPYGELIQSLTRKIKKSYDVVGGRTKQFYSAEFMSYTGEYEVLQVEYEGKICDLYRLKKSGILTLNDDALFWMCGGGSGGRSGHFRVNNDDTDEYNYSGGGGAGAYAISGELNADVYTVAVGGGGSANAVGANTQILSDDAVVFAVNGGGLGTKPYDGGIGGTGGGASVGAKPVEDFTGEVGKGDGKSKYPFGLTSLLAHCPGGGGGAYIDKGNQVAYRRHGGNGGTNGGNGRLADHPNSVPQYMNGGTGGVYGGGAGSGIVVSSNLIDAATAGTYYGAGGGGGAILMGTAPMYNKGPTSGQAGYQGVVYILDVNGGVPA